jgi:sugar phosphate permease
MFYKTKKIYFLTLPFLMWLLPLSFFGYQFILRLYPSLMMHDIMAQFKIDASSFGIMASFYYYGYSLSQIPIAFFLDKYNPKNVIAFLIMLCGVSNMIFCYTDNFYLAGLSRFFIGIGSAVGFLGVSKIVTEWFSKENYSKMIGYSFTIGLTGAIYGGKPLASLIENYNSKNITLWLSIVSFIISILIFWTLKTPNTNNKSRNKEQFGFGQFKSVISSKSIWMLGIANFLMVGTLEGFADVWGVSYLGISFGFTKSEAAGLISLIFIGMLFGGPLLAFLSKKFSGYYVIFGCGFGMAISFILLLSHCTVNHILLGVIFFSIGIMCCYQVIIFGVGSQLTEKESAGLAVAFLNCMNMLGGSFFHTIIGKVMDIFWTGNFCINGLKNYEITSYQYAIAIIPISAIIGSIIAISSKK